MFSGTIISKSCKISSIFNSLTNRSISSSILICLLIPDNALNDLISNLGFFVNKCLCFLMNDVRSLSSSSILIL